MTDGMIWTVIICGFIVCLTAVYAIHDYAESRRVERPSLREWDYMKADMTAMKAKCRMLARELEQVKKER